MVCLYNGILFDRYTEAKYWYGQALETSHTHTPGVVLCAFHPSICEAEAGGLLGVQDHPGLQIKFQNIQGYIKKS